MKKFLRSSASAALAVCMLLVGTMSTFAADLDSQISQKETQISEAQAQGAALAGQKQAVEESLAGLQVQLNLMETEAEETQEEIDDKLDEIHEAEEYYTQIKLEEHEQYEGMKLRIKFLYETGDTSMLASFLSDADSLADFINRSEYAESMSGYDRQLLEEYQATLLMVEAEEEELQREYDELIELQAQLEEQKSSISANIASQSALVAQLESQLGANAAEVAALRSQLDGYITEQAEAEAKVEAESAQSTSETGKKQAADDAAPEKTEKAKEDTAGKKAKAEAVEEPEEAFDYAAYYNAAYAAAICTLYSPGSDCVSGNGMLCNPCPSGTLSSGFGYRDFDQSFHKGIDLATSAGSPIYAAADGTVIIAGFSLSAGNWIVIDHGNGLVTKYMHNAQLFVYEGQTVHAGQNIAAAGTTGNSTGVHLHFQVEADGVAVNPQSYL